MVFNFSQGSSTISYVFSSTSKSLARRSSFARTRTPAATVSSPNNNASLLVEQLEAKRLIERRVNGADRRARLLRVTPRGQRLYDRLRPAVFAAQERLLTLLGPDEREQFIDMLVRVIEGNRGLARPGTGRRKRGSRQSPSNKA